MNIKKILLIGLGSIGLTIGAIGAVLPFLPSFPFLLLAAICFARSSERLDRWFRNTKLYKNNLESYVNGQGMSPRTKLKIMGIVTLLFSIAGYMMRRVLIGQIVLLVIWAFHIFYFVIVVKNKTPS